MADLTIPLDSSAINFVLGIIGGVIAKFAHGKLTAKKVIDKEHQLRIFIDALDNAIRDPKIDQTALESILSAGQALVSK